MQDLKYISYVEEQNGIAEALYMLEERVDAGGDDKVTVLRLLFLYWFMEHEPAFFAKGNSSREWAVSFRELADRYCAKFKQDSEFNSVAGFLFCKFSGRDMHARGEELMHEAICLQPGGMLPQLFLRLAKGETVGVSGVDLENSFSDWGMLGDYLRHVLAGFS